MTRISLDGSLTTAALILFLSNSMAAFNSAMSLSLCFDKTNFLVFSDIC